VCCFHCALPPLFILPHFNVDGLCNFFFNLILECFLGFLVIIKKQLILNSYEMVGLKEKRSKWKTWQILVACHKFQKTWTLVLQLKQSYKLYNFGPSTFFQFHFGTTIYFCYFLILGWERRERSLDFSSRERNMLLTLIYATKMDDICVKLFHLMRGIHIRCFCSLKVREKNRSKLELIFCFKLSSVFGTMFWGHE